jgi:hypothetical protein
MSVRVSLSALVLATLALTLGATAYAHHGWGGYDNSKVLTLTGVIRESTYEHPHGTIKLAVDDKTWDVVLAPPSRMEIRGLAKTMLAVGTRATVVGYPHRNDASEVRAERITINGKTTELR